MTPRWVLLAALIISIAVQLMMFRENTRLSTELDKLISFCTSPTDPNMQRVHYQGDK